MMPGETQSKSAGIASEASGACQNCATLQQNLNEYITALIALKQKIIDSDQLLTEYQQKCEELHFADRENDTLRCQLEQMLQKIVPQEKSQEELKSLREQLEEKTSSLKIYQETQMEYIRLKEEYVKSNAIKKKLEAKLKKMEDSSMKQMKEFKELKKEKKGLEKELNKMEKERSDYQNRKRKKDMKNAQTQVANGEPGLSVDKRKIKHLLEQLWDCIDSSTDNDKIELQMIDDQLHRARGVQIRERKNGKRYLTKECLDDCPIPASHSSPPLSSPMQIEQTRLPIIQALNESNKRKKESKWFDEAATDCNGDSAFYEDKTTDFVPRDFIDDCSPSSDHEEDPKELLHFLDWAKPLPPLLSPIHFFPPVTRDLFGEFTDSSDEEQSLCQESLPTKHNEEYPESSENSASLKDEENNSLPLNSSTVFEKPAEINSDSEAGENHEVSFTNSSSCKNNTLSENSNNFTTTVEMLKALLGHEPLQIEPGSTKKADHESLSPTKMNISDYSEISSQPQSNNSVILTENTNTNKQDITVLSKETCLQSFDYVKDQQLTNPASSELKSIESGVIENQEECQRSCNAAEGLLEIGMDFTIHDEVQESKDDDSELLCKLSYSSSVNSEISEGKCNADVLPSSVHNSKEGLPHGPVSKNEGLHDPHITMMEVQEVLKDNIQIELNENIQELNSIAIPCLTEPNNHNLPVSPEALDMSSASEHTSLINHENIQFAVQPNKSESTHCTEDLQLDESVKSCSEGEHNLSKETSVQPDSSAIETACLLVDNQDDKPMHLEDQESKEINSESDLLPKSPSILTTANQELAKPESDMFKERSELGDTCTSTSAKQDCTVKSDLIDSLQNNHSTLENIENNMSRDLKIVPEEQNKESSSTPLQCGDRNDFSKATLHPKDEHKADHGQTISDHEINVAQNEKMLNIFNYINSSLIDAISEMTISPDQKSQWVTAADTNGILDQKENHETKKHTTDKTDIASSNYFNISLKGRDVTETLSKDTSCSESKRTLCSESESCVLDNLTVSLKKKLPLNIFQSQQESINGNAECIIQSITSVPNAKKASPADTKLVLEDICINTPPPPVSDGESQICIVSEESDQKNIYVKSPEESQIESDAEVSDGERSPKQHIDIVNPVVKTVDEKACLLDKNGLKVAPVIEVDHKGKELQSNVPDCDLGVKKFNDEKEALPCMTNDTDESEEEILVRKVSIKTSCSANLSKPAHSMESKCLVEVSNCKNDSDNSVTCDQTDISELHGLTNDLKEKNQVEGAVSNQIPKDESGAATLCSPNNERFNQISETSLSAVSSTQAFRKPGSLEIKNRSCIELDNSKCKITMDFMSGETGERSSLFKPSSTERDDSSSKSQVQESTACAETNRRIIPSKNLIWNFDRSDPDCRAVALPIKPQNRKSLLSRSDSFEQCLINANPNKVDELRIMTRSVSWAQAKIVENGPPRPSVGRTSSQITILANADTSTKTELSLEMILNKVRSEMGPPLKPLLDPLMATPPRCLQPLSPILSPSSRSSLPSPLDDLLSPLQETPIKPLMSPLMDNRRYKSPDFTTPSPSEKVDGRILSSPLQFCAATPKHALPVPGRLPPSATGGSVSTVQENSVKILDTMYPELSARARTLNILKGNVQLNRCLPGDCKTAPLNQITGFKAISSNSTAFIKTGSNLKTSGRDKQPGCDSPKRPGNKRTSETIPMPKSAKRLRLDSESPSREVIKDCFSAPASKVPVVKQTNELCKVDFCNSESLPDVAEDIHVDDSVTNAFKKIEELCFDLLPVIRSHVHVGTMPSIPVMRNEEKEVIYEFSSTKKDLSEHFLRAILKKLKADKTTLDSKHLQALCRVYVGLCRQLGDMERARVLCYSILKEGFPEPDKLILFIISAWSNMFSMHGIISKAMQSVLKHLAKEDVLQCLSAYLNWEKNPPLPIGTILSSVLMAIQFCPDVKFHVSQQYGEDLTEYIWEYVFAVDLLCCQRKWMWTHDQVIRKELWPILDKYVKYKKGCVNIPCVPDIIVATVLRLVGRLCQIGLKEGFVAAVKNVSSVIVAFIQQAKEEDIPWGVQLASAYMLCDVASCDPAAIHKTLQTWRQSASSAIPPAITSYLAEVASLCLEKGESLF